MQINWKVRFQNKTFLTGLISLVVVFIYDLLQLLEIVPTVTQSAVMQVTEGILTILGIGSIFSGDFGLFYVVTKNSGRIYDVTDVIDTYIYRGLTQLSNVGMSTAAGLYQSVVGFIMVLFANWVVTKIDPDSAMF